MLKSKNIFIDIFFLLNNTFCSKIKNFRSILDSSKPQCVMQLLQFSFALWYSDPMQNFTVQYQIILFIKTRWKKTIATYKAKKVFLSWDVWLCSLQQILFLSIYLNQLNLKFQQEPVMILKQFFFHQNFVFPL